MDVAWLELPVLTTRSLPALCLQAEYLESLPAGHGCHSFVGRGLYAPLLRIWSRHFEVGKDLLVLTLEEMKEKGTQHVLDRVFKFLRMPPHVLADTAPSNSRKYKAENVAGQELMDTLAAFYEPHNRALDAVMASLGLPAPGY